MNYKVVGNIYGKLQDEQSRYIFSNRLLYSLTNDERYIQNVIYDSGGGRKLQKAIESHRGQPLILFGAGFWGRRILRFFPNENWCCYVDNILSSETMIDGLQVISFEEMKKKYSAPFIVIATRKYYKEIEKQLKDNGFDMKNTISSGRLSDEMIQNQYFETSVVA